MEREHELVSEEFRETYGDEMAEEIEEYLRSYPFSIQESQESSDILYLLINKKHKNQASRMSALMLSL